jgi:predicted helicase
MPPVADLDHLRSIKTLPSLIAYLRDELDWPIEADETEDVTFDYDPEELGFDKADAVHIKEIKQIRPLDAKQPWGIFWVNLEKKRLPVVMLRRILANLVLKKRASANKASQRAWHLNDLLFISAYGEETDRAITFAHFSQDAESPGDLPVLKVLGWDDGDTVLHLVDAHRTLGEKLRWPAPPANVEAWRSQWGDAFTLRHREVITTTSELVEELARLADATRRRARTILARESERGPLRRLYAAFKAALIHDLTEDDFADVIAQTISYGLLIARFSRAAISAQNLVDMVPATNPFLRELLGTFLALAGRQKAFDFDELGIQDVVEVLNRANADAVKADFGNRTRGEDPVIHFYEHFLAAYDKKKKIQRGVFYTPQPVVSYIVRSVHELLQTEFGIEDGLASTVTWADMLKRHPELKLPKVRAPKAGKAEGEEVDLSSDEFFVMILDIATGTGTFLVETIEVIFQHLQAKWAKHGLQGMPIIRHTALRIPSFKDYWNAYVPAALLPRLYGYELMMAPYTIAHMKLALKLSEINARLGQTDYLFKFDGRANIYLTNTLEPPSGFQTQQFADFFPALAHEATAVNAVKRSKHFTLVIGNPPYSNYGQLNRIPFILDLLEDYKRGLDEKKLNLDDDFIKFVRYTQLLIERAGCGCVGMITNNTYLDGVTHRRMRQSLLECFQRVSVTDLHGSTKRREVAPDGTPDENVFDIQQGVAIAIFRRMLGNSEAAIEHTDLWGNRDAKYAALAKAAHSVTNWNSILPTQPQFFLVPKVFAVQTEYDDYFPLREAVVVSGNGLKTERDGVTIHFNRSGIEEAVADFRKLDEARIRTKFGLETDSRDWKVAKAKADVLTNKGLSLFRLLLYRPFDNRYTWYSGQTRGFIGTPGYPVMRHLLQGSNFALVSGRQGQVMGDIPWDLVFCTSNPVDTNLYYRGGNTVFPLYLCEEPLSFALGTEEDGSPQSANRRPNFSPSFLKSLASKLHLPQKGAFGLPFGLTPEDIFHYAYGVFHSPGYRSRYAEFLKIEFPRLPLTGNMELFRALARLGDELVALHLLESPKLDKPITEFVGGRGPAVEKVSWSRDTVWLDKAQTSGFKGVREGVWNFHIGGYQVCAKWLKDRKGRNLTADDRAHYQKIVVALSETIRLMKEIDTVIEKHGGWPLK